MDDEELQLAESSYWSQARSRYRHPVGRKTRDVRHGDRWLPWHFTPEFEQRLRDERARMKTVGG